MRQKKNVGKRLERANDRKINAKFSENALKMMRKRYLLQDESGNYETPAEMFRRVGVALASVEKKYGKNDSSVKKYADDFFQVMSNHEFTPAGRTLTNAGSSTALIANCIVLPIRDSMESIFQTLKDASLLQQAGSGLGFAIDEMRPAMYRTIRSRGTSSGPVSFLKVYNEAFSTIKQQGRHGANMAMMSVEHPDVIDFIRAKEVEGEIRNFNISVKITDAFMKQLKESPSTQWYCTWGGEKLKPHKVLRHPNGSVYGIEEIDITVGELFDELVNYAWLNGEPGIVFIDTVNRTNPLTGLGAIGSSNPCGEQFLHPYDNCNLGSINLAVFAKRGKVNWERLEFVTKVAVRMLDNVIDLFDFPVLAVTEMAKKNRRIGLGIMGFADMLYELGIQYNSKEGIAMGEKVMSFIQEVTHKTSRVLAREKAPFPNIGLSVFAKKRIKMRNAALTTVAPTGSISMMLDTSSGIEPNFALAYVKQDKDGTQYKYLNKYFEAELLRRKFDSQKIEAIKEEVVQKGTIQHLADVPEDLRKRFVVAMDISGRDHMLMQAAFQRHVDNSISKTINFPNTATKDEIKESFILAWEAGCKSATVYRDGSRNVQVLNIGTGENIVSITDIPNKKSALGGESGEAQVEAPPPRRAPRARPAVMSGKTYKIKTGYGNLYITINNDEEGKPFEVFATIGKSGGFFQEQSEGICRLISMALRSGINPEEIINDLKGIRGPMPTFTDKGTILSLPDAIARILEEHIQAPQALETPPTLSESQNMTEPAVVMARVDFVDKEKRSVADYGMMPGCPDCGEALQLTEGCLSCRGCGFSRCT